MAELAEGILNKIQDETKLHNDKIDVLIAAQLEMHKDNMNLQIQGTTLDDKATKYAQEQQGQEVMYSRIAQHLQEKTQEELVKLVQTDTPGVVSDDDILKVDEIGKGAKKKRDEKIETSAEKRTKLLEKMEEDGKNLLGATVANWSKNAKSKLTEMGSFSKFSGAIKNDMNLMLGKFQLLTQLPGVTSLLQGLKYLFATLVTFFLGGKGFKFMEPMIQKIENAMMALGIKSKTQIKEAREVRALKSDETGKPQVKAKGLFGKKYDVDSPQGKMIAQSGSLYRDTRKKFTALNESIMEGFDKMIIDAKVMWWNSDAKKDLKGKTEKFKDTFKKSFEDIGESMSKMFQKLKVSKLGQGISKAISWVGTGLKKVGKRMMMMMTQFFIQVAIFFAGIAMAIAAFIVANIIPIAIIAVIALLVIGIIWLVAYLTSKWEEIKINFYEAIDMLKLKFSKENLINFFKTIVENIWLGIQQMAVNIRVGIENMVNNLIQKWNDFMPGERFDMSPIDLGGKEAETAMATERAKVESQQQERGESLAAKEKEIRDKYDEQRIAAGIAPKNTVTQTNVNNTTQSKQYVASGTSASDAFALNMASRSPTY